MLKNTITKKQRDEAKKQQQEAHPWQYWENKFPRELGIFKKQYKSAYSIINLFVFFSIIILTYKSKTPEDFVSSTEFTTVINDQANEKIQRLLFRLFAIKG